MVKQSSTEMVASIRNIRDRLTGEKVLISKERRKELKDMEGRGGA